MLVVLKMWSYQFPDFFDIYFYVHNLIIEHLTIRRKKNFDLLQSIVFENMRIHLAIVNLQWSMSWPRLPQPNKYFFFFFHIFF